MNFPDSPSVGTTYQYGGNEWTFNGKGWKLFNYLTTGSYTAKYDSLFEFGSSTTTTVTFING